MPYHSIQNLLFDGNGSRGPNLDAKFGGVHLESLWGRSLCWPCITSLVESVQQTERAGCQAADALQACIHPEVVVNISRDDGKTMFGELDIASSVKASNFPVSVSYHGAFSSHTICWVIDCVIQR